MQAMLAAVLALVTGAAGFLPTSLPPRLAASRGQLSSSMIMNAESGRQDGGGEGLLLTRAGWLQVSMHQAFKRAIRAELWLP